MSASMSTIGLTGGRTRSVETLDHFRFTMIFRLRTPTPLDLIPILSNDPEKQRALTTKSLRDARRIYGGLPHAAMQWAEDTASIEEERFSERLAEILKTLEDQQRAFESRCMENQDADACIGRRARVI